MVSDIYKGPDRANLRSEHVGDEIESYRDLRYFGASESCWRLFGFDLFDQKPPVKRLPFHLHEGQMIFHRQGEEEEAADTPNVSMFIDWLEYCRAPRPPLPSGWGDLTYVGFPRKFTHQRNAG